MKIKYIAICLILLCCIMGTACAAEDISTDVVSDSVDDAVVVDAVPEDIDDSVSVDDAVVVDAVQEDVSDSVDDAVSEDTTIEEIVGDVKTDEISEESAIGDSEQTRRTGIDVANWDDLLIISSDTTDDYDITLINPLTIGGSIEFKNSATIIGSPDCYITGNSSSIVFTSTGDLNIRFVNVTFKNINTSDVFMKLSTSGINTFENCNFSNIYTDAPDNHSSVIWNYGGVMNITNCTFSNCNDTFGAVTNHNTPTSVTMYVDKCKFENNYARKEPGAINNCGILTVTDSEFNNNSAFWWAGAIHTHYNAKTTINRCNFTDNEAGWNGGALYTYSILNVSNSNFKRNKCYENTGGGAIGASNWWMGNYNITIVNCTFEENENCNTSGCGGAITAMNSGALNVHNSTFINNTAPNGQAISAYSKKFENISAGIPNLKVYNNTFYNHTLTTSDTVEISGNYTFENNTFYYCRQVNQGTNNNIYYPITSNNIVIPSIITKNILTSTSIEDILSDEVPSILYVNVSADYGDGSGNDWENPMKGKFSLSQAITKIANEGIIYVASGEYTNFRGYGEKNYTIIAEDNTFFTASNLQDNSNGGIHTCINLIFYPTTFIMNNSRIDCERIFINCTIKADEIRLDNGNLYEESTGLMRFENCVFEDYNTFINIGMHANVTFNNCTFKNIQADSLIKITSNLIQFVKLSDCTFENCVMNGVVNLGMNVDPEDYVAIEDCNYDFDATLGMVSDGEENYYINATKLKVVAVDSAVDISSSEKGVVVIALTDNSSAPIAGATVKYTVNGGEEQTDVTGEDGKFTITGLTGEVTIAVSYEGNESFNPITGSQFFNFTEEPAPSNDTNGTNDTPAAPTKVATKLTAPKVTATYNVAKKLVITLKDANGKVLANKKVTVKVGTISKTLKTNSKGQVSVAVNTLVPKTYTATIKFAGDNDYKASSLSAKVTVKKAAPKLTAAKKTFKVKAKTKKVTATLKNNKGKVLKKVKLTLKIGKKTYTAKTNSKGVATFKVKLTKKGTYTGTVKFAGSKYYKAATKKVKIAVKK